MPGAAFIRRKYKERRLITRIVKRGNPTNRQLWILRVVYLARFGFIVDDILNSRRRVFPFLGISQRGASRKSDVTIAEELVCYWSVVRGQLPVVVELTIWKPLTVNPLTTDH
jgi:hypothetical protein